jgi:hypothetical protein
LITTAPAPDAPSSRANAPTAKCLQAMDVGDMSNLDGLMIRRRA